MMPSCTGGGGGACTLNARPPCTSTSDVDVLLDAVLVDLELAGLEVGNELIGSRVADDDVGRDEVDVDAEGGLAL